MHPAQLDREQPPQPPPPEPWSEPHPPESQFPEPQPDERAAPCMAKVENLRSVFRAPHFSHGGQDLSPMRWRASNSWPHFLQLYS